MPARVVSNQWLGDQTHIAADVAGKLAGRWSRTTARALDVGETDRPTHRPRRTCTSSTRDRRGHLARAGASLRRDARDLLIGIDAGTSVIKSVAFTLTASRSPSPRCRTAMTRRGPGGVEQDMPRTWADTRRRRCASSATRSRTSPPRGAIAVTAQGDGTWLIDGDGEPVGNGWLWLDARAADDRRGHPRHGRDDRARFETTGSGLNACQQGPQLAWLKRHHAGAAGARRDRLPLQGLALFPADRRARDRSVRRQLHLRQLPHARSYPTTSSTCSGIADLRRLLPPIVDGAARSTRLSAAAAAVTGLPAGMPVVLGYVDVVCTALGGGLYDRAAHRLLGLRLDRHAYAARAQRRRRAPQRERTGYTMCFPVPGTYAQMQSNMAATLNIDWLLDLAAGRPRLAGVRARAARAARRDRRVDLRRARRPSLLYHPYISRRASAGRSSTRTPARVHRAVDRATAMPT